MSARTLTVWWGIPCKSAIPMFRHMAEALGYDVLFVALNDLPEKRKKLGWTVPPHGALPLEVLADGPGWRGRAEALMDAREGLHIVNGIYHDPRVRHVALSLAAGDKRFGVIMEAPSNLETGVKRMAKAVIAPIVTPFRTRTVARKARFVLSASGDRERAFRMLGFAAEGIYPFGYFPDFPALPRAAARAEALRLLCLGYLEPFKGQDVLLKALSILRQRSIPFRCTITGFGPAEAAFKALSARLGLDDAVDFAGVVSNERLAALFAEANALVAPGIEEPWGIRINEGLLSGLPVVVSDGIGAKELVAASGAGEVFQAGSEHALADALSRLFGRLSGSGELADRIAAFRPAITPAAAAAFLDAVLTHRDGGGERPVPPWLQTPVAQAA